MNKQAKEAIKAGLIGGGLGFIVSALANYFIVPLPEGLWMNALNNGLSGSLSGLAGGFFGVWLLPKKAAAENDAEPIVKY